MIIPDMLYHAVCWKVKAALSRFNAQLDLGTPLNRHIRHLAIALLLEFLQDESIEVLGALQTLICGGGLHTLRFLRDVLQG
jgi:hypothetical protein